MVVQKHNNDEFYSIWLNNLTAARDFATVWQHQLLLRDLRVEQFLCDSVCLLLLPLKQGMFSVNWPIDRQSTYCSRSLHSYYRHTVCCFPCTFLHAQSFDYFSASLALSLWPSVVRSLISRGWDSPHSLTVSFFSPFSHAAGAGQPQRAAIGDRSQRHWSYLPQRHHRKPHRPLPC